jgi:hypothetical protein
VPSEHSYNDEVNTVISSKLSDGNNDTLSSSDESNSPKNVTVYSAPSGCNWQENPPPLTRHLRHNIVTQQPGLTTYSDNAATVSETLRLFLTDEMLDIICKHTND